VHNFRNGFETGAAVVWIYSALTNVVPAYKGTNHILQWLNALMHVIGANPSMVHIPRRGARPHAPG
jgi:hypothetical protein